ncbi:L,D-transpeptidase family protein [Streptomyces sp. NPDC021356]|uniref:L,D-transpeptidase family protein n=1 Tax=Streptomyces sp. NPDC021356 TaxID=3154900 RepID=UPI0033E6AE4E
MASPSKHTPRGRHRAPTAGDQIFTTLSRAGGRLPLTAAALVVAATVTGCGASGAGASHDTSAAVSADGPTAAAPSARDDARPMSGVDNAAPELPTQLPGLGPKTLSQVPAETRQVVLVTGQGKNSNRSGVVLYQRTADGWKAGATWAAHNALKGWTDDHRAGDLRSPIGVFTLSDAGGRLSDPGSRLPYTRSSGGYTVGGLGFNGEPLAGAFDYVIAIDYNHKKGTTPLDWTRPLGADKGGGIWLHVDHGGPTHGCVSIAKRHMKELLGTLDPAQHPVVVMGDAGSLSR